MAVAKTRLMCCRTSAPKASSPRETSYSAISWLSGSDMGFSSILPLKGKSGNKSSTSLSAIQHLIETAYGVPVSHGAGSEAFRSQNRHEPGLVRFMLEVYPEVAANNLYAFTLRKIGL